MGHAMPRPAFPPLLYLVSKHIRQTREGWTVEAETEEAVLLRRLRALPPEELARVEKTILILLRRAAFRPVQKTKPSVAPKERRQRPPMDDRNFPPAL